jgi:hypothetical protein
MGFTMEAMIHIYQILSAGSLLFLTLWFFVWCSDNDCLPLAWLALFVWAFYTAFPFLQFCFALLPILFLAYWIKKLFFPASNFRTLFEVDDQQNHTQSSYNAPSNGSNQVSPEEISTSNSMPVFLRKRAQRLGLTSASAPVPIPTPGSSSYPANSANGQPTVSSQSAPVDPVDPTLLPPSDDVPGQTIYRRIIPIKP